MSTPFYDLASLVVVSSGYKASKVYAQKPLTTDGQLTFSRASTATRVNSAGLIETVSSNVPRLDYLGSTCPKLQLEPQRSNIFPNSETTATWAFTNMTRTANHGISPDGTQDADLLSAITSGVVNFNSDTTFSNLTIGQPFVCSFFIKLNQSFNSNIGQNIIEIRLGTTAMWSRPTVRINLVTGSVTAVQNASYLSSTNYGNGWFRITFGGTPTGTSATTLLQIPTGTTMDGGSFYIWGLQGEANATYATSYVKTTTAAVTRLADACSKTGISSLIGQTEGTVYWEGEKISNANFASPLVIDNGTSNRIYLLSGSTGFRVDVTSGGTSTAFYSGTQGLGTYKIAIAYSSAGVEVYINGASVFTDSSVTIPACQNLYLSNWASYAEAVKTSQALLFKTRLTNAQLAELTAL